MRIEDLEESSEEERERDYRGRCKGCPRERERASDWCCKVAKATRCTMHTWHCKNEWVEKGQLSKWEHERRSRRCRCGRVGLEGERCGCGENYVEELGQVGGRRGVGSGEMSKCRSSGCGRVGDVGKNDGYCSIIDVKIDVIYFVET